MPECAKNRTNAEGMSMDTVCTIGGGKEVFPERIEEGFLKRRFR